MTFGARTDVLLVLFILNFYRHTCRRRVEIDTQARKQAGSIVVKAKGLKGGRWQREISEYAHARALRRSILEERKSRIFMFAPCGTFNKKRSGRRDEMAN